MRICILLAALALFLVGCGQQARPMGQSAGAGSVTSVPTSQAPVSLVPKDTRPVSSEELGKIGYTEKKTTDGHDEWSTGPRVNFPVLVIRNGKITQAKSEDETFTCNLVLDTRRLEPATAVQMYKTALMYKAGSPSTSTTPYQRGGDVGTVVCDYSPR